jgi:hypothetical protein
MTEELRNKTITCRECGEDFVWTVGEQRYFHARGFTNEPKRCRPCREEAKERLAEQKTKDERKFGR